jgi:structure-specific recognition protein 1
MMSLDLAQVSQCVLPGNNRNEIELQFPESDAVEAGTDQLVAVRFYIPPDPEADPADKTADTAAELLQQRIMHSANIRKTTGDVIVSFAQNKGTFLTPRGRYSIELYDYFLRLRGQKYDYKIKYDDINRLFLLPKPDEVHMAFVIALDKPIRQGQQRYQYLVLQATKEPDEVTVNLDEETLKNEYGGELQPVMRGSLSNLVAKTFKVIAKKKVFIPGKFSNAAQQACVKCAVRANEGLLYPLEKQFVFIHKPPILIRFNELESVEFQRYAGGQGSTRNFDLCVNLKSSVTGGGTPKDYTFSGIDRSDYASLYNFLSGKKIPIKNLQGSAGVFLDEPQAGPPVYNEDEIYGGPDEGGLEEDSEDEDFDEDAAAAAEEDISDDSDMDDDEMGSEVDEDLDSDLEERRTDAKKKKKKSKPAVDEDEDENDEESPKKKRKKSKKDPKAPKKAMSAYMLYAGAARSKVVAENPDASFGGITQIIAADFKKLSPEERTKWDEKANDDKQRYQDQMEDYSAPEDNNDSDGGNKAKKKAKKDPNAPKRAMTAYFFFMNESRDRIKKENPEASFSEIAKIAGTEWRSMSNKDKAKYEAMATKDKSRYSKEMTEYKPTGGATSSKKANKDPNAPKKAMTSFFYFLNEMRPKIKQENPDMSFGELGKKAGELFRALSTNQKEKYEKMAKSDKLRFKEEMSKYNAKNAAGSDIEDEEDSDADGLHDNNGDESNDDSDDE